MAIATMPPPETPAALPLAKLAVAFNESEATPAIPPE